MQSPRLDSVRRWAQLALLCAPVCALGAAACRQDMHDQAKYEALEGSEFFADGRAARPSIPGTIARGELASNELLATGKLGGEFATAFPLAVDRALLERGRERYGIFCAPCHDAAGNGSGMIVERGMKRPPSLHIERLRSAPPGYHFDVIARGFGAMFDLSDRIPPEDRWAIVAWVRVLQRSQNASLADVPPQERQRLEQRQ
jgi:cbb3-type cytochrome c oxidase subunit III